MKIRAVLLLTSLAGVALWQKLSSPVAVYSQAAAGDKSTDQFRIVVGLKEQQPTKWDGRITISGGELTSFEGWRFSEKDSAKPDGAFSFSTKLGNLENQLLPDHPYGQTGWDDPKARCLIPQGVILRVRGSGSALVSLQSTAGGFNFRTNEVVYGTRVWVLDGEGYVERLPLERKLSESGYADDYPALTIAPDGTRWVAWLAYKDKADEVVVSNGSMIFHISGRGDLHAPAIASDGKDGVQVVWTGPGRWNVSSLWVGFSERHLVETGEADGR